jgi:hypothetical protein
MFELLDLLRRGRLRRTLAERAQVLGSDPAGAQPTLGGHLRLIGAEHVVAHDRELLALLLLRGCCHLCLGFLVRERLPGGRELAPVARCSNSTSATYLPHRGCSSTTTVTAG